MNKKSLAALGGSRLIPQEFQFKKWPMSTKQDEEYVLASIRQSIHSSWGPNGAKLQNEFAKWNGNQYALVCNSGTAALHMAIAACEIKPGDEVITTCMSWPASATCILHHNAIPVFVDVDWETMLINPDLIESSITPKTKAILVVHYFGSPCDMDAILAIAKKHNLKVIEDACQAHGTTYKGKKVGTFGDCAAFSLNQNKNLSSGEGGIFVTDSHDMLMRGMSLMNFGELSLTSEGRNKHDYGMGWMYRMPDITAAYARSGLSRLDETNALAISNWHMLKSELSGIPNIVLPTVPTWGTTNGYAFVMRLLPGNKDICRDQLSLNKATQATLVALRAEGVPVHTSPWIIPAHTLFQEKKGYGNGCPWTCNERQNISYDLSQYPVAIQSAQTSIQIAFNGHRPPNGLEELNWIVNGVRKVLNLFSSLDDLDFTELAKSYNFNQYLYWL
jgi:perosamine synthetase